MIEIKRGDVFYADLGDGVGSEQQGIRPVVVIQNDIGNKFSPTVIVAAITSKRFNKNLPTHVTLSQEQYNLHMPSTILAEQVRTIDKKRLKGVKEYSLNELDIIRLDRALDVSFERLKSRMSGVASFAV